ncbi:hypothetical protein J2S00_003417 [Caldalkalibacillus uzonensis]|uniref:Uncharacterized protein n=1 Tax=Caldalkalibacillus uzonensis TaxID=353224 RepID=A0ABU0CWV7_9BACI|nr:hypothetical protein [Caldalkalibacillus uzonensis]MDQ0340593.1 hypothetical protein [Caldalkalibacillus uzonensis]
MTPEEFEDMLEHMEVRQKKLDCIKEKLITWLKQYPDISRHRSMIGLRRDILTLRSVKVPSGAMLVN